MRGWLWVRREPLLLTFTALALVFGTVYLQGSVTLPIEMRSHGLSPELYGQGISINRALIVLLGIPASNRAACWPRFAAMAAAGLLLGGGFGVTGLAAGLGLYALSVGIWTLGEIAAASVAPAVVADLSPAEMLRGGLGPFLLHRPDPGRVGLRAVGIERLVGRLPGGRRASRRRLPGDGARGLAAHSPGAKRARRVADRRLSPC